jgi:hypothetical protein
MGVYRPMSSGGTRSRSDAPHCYRADEPTKLFLGAVASPQSRPPLHSACSVYCSHRFGTSRCRACGLAPLLPPLASFVQLAIALGEDLSCATFQLVHRCNVADRAVQPNRVVQVNNQKPISVKHERSVIRGIHGVIVVYSSMRRSRRMAAYFFDAALKRPGTRVRWRYLTGCSSPPAAGYVQPTRLPWTAKRFVISRRCSTVRPLMTT